MTTHTQHQHTPQMPRPIHLLTAGVILLMAWPSAIRAQGTTGTGAVSGTGNDTVNAIAQANGGQLTYLLVSPAGVQRGVVTAEMVATRPALRQLQKSTDNGSQMRDPIAVGHLRFGTSVRSGQAAPFVLVIQSLSTLPMAPAWYRLGAVTNDAADMFASLEQTDAATTQWALREGYLILESSSGTFANGRIGAVFTNPAGGTLTISGHFLALSPGDSGGHQSSRR